MVVLVKKGISLRKESHHEAQPNYPDISFTFNHLKRESGSKVPAGIPHGIGWSGGNGYPYRGSTPYLV
jgi:hypothetical protein